MSVCIGGIILPYFSELMKPEGGEEAGILPTALEKAAESVVLCKPQAVILLSPGGAAVDDGVTVHVQPRVKGKVREHVVGFETEHLLGKAIFYQSERLGIAMYPLTDDFCAENKLNAYLTEEAATLLYFLHRAGFKGQVVHMNYGNLLYEEMYTLGKAVQLAVGRVRKNSIVAVGAGLSKEHSEKEEAWNKNIVGIVKERNVKLLLETAKNKPEGMAERDLRALFFLLGSLSTLDVRAQNFYYQKYLGQGQMTGCFLQSKGS